MLMKPVEVKEIKEKLREFIEKNDLDHGNAEVTVQDDAFIMTVEGPQHSTITLWFGSEDADGLTNHFHQTVINKMAGNVKQFDVNEEFNDLWSPSFGKHNSFTPTQFLQILTDDKAYLQEVVHSFLV